jgi:NAD(P)-dependent dehydrogenase (short-subunit alcohol dehydrogenase family)
VIVVTGGASGIASAMVEQFALQGSRVAFLAIDRELAAELVNRLGAVSHAPLFFSRDVTDIARLRAALGEVERRLGPVGVLVNNAASDDRHDFARRRSIGMSAWP